jgi:hypothetical protein
VAIPVAGCVVVLARDYIHLRSLRWAKEAADGCEPKPSGDDAGMVVIDADSATVNVKEKSQSSVSRAPADRPRHRIHLRRKR